MEDRLRRLLTLLSSQVPRELIEQARQELDYGEYGLAIENLVEQIEEGGYRLSSEQVVALNEAAENLGLDESRWRVGDPEGLR